MTAERYEHFMVISDIESVSDIAECNMESIFAIVFQTDSELSFTESDREFFKKCPFLTVLFCSDASGFTAEFIMSFDTVISGNDYCISAEDYSALDEERYRILCGLRDTYELKKHFSKKNSGPYRSSLVKKTELSAEEYCAALFRDKNSEEISCIIECLTAARTGKNEDVFSMESKNFYRMVREKVKGC